MIRFFCLLALFGVGVLVASGVELARDRFLPDANIANAMLGWALWLGGALFALGTLCRTNANGIWSAFVLGASSIHIVPALWDTLWRTGSLAIYVLLFGCIVSIEYAARKEQAALKAKSAESGPGRCGGGAG